MNGLTRTSRNRRKVNSMTDNNAINYNGIDVLTELDLIQDAVDLGGISRNCLVDRLSALINKIGRDKSRKIWDSDEIYYLIDNYRDVSNAELSKKLNRPIASINVKAHRYGLKKSQSFLSMQYRKNAFGDAPSVEIVRPRKNVSAIEQFVWASK